MSNDFVPPSPIRTWLIEDNRSFRNTVAKVLNQAAGIECQHQFSAASEALAALAKTGPPDVILLDIDLPEMSGLDAISRIKAAAPESQVVMLTVSDDPDKISRALCTGASGYLLKSASIDRIAEAVREVATGGVPMTPRVARMVLTLLPRASSDTPPEQKHGLTDREQDVLELMVQGLAKKEIADRLSLSFHTVDTHIRNIYAKLHVHTRSGAVAKALNGLPPKGTDYFTR